MGQENSENKTRLDNTPLHFESVEMLYKSFYLLSFTGPADLQSEAGGMDIQKGGPGSSDSRRLQGHRVGQTVTS